ncbi:hypothetical protein XELAEV_18046293mg [Xenopus laevis]|uniref:Secreted protein n=1 Tax=Xenopus laevis TaxID=8355 RepID=A0A974BT19_XENLA|nr:hypothetical protein XELAEV_18046293mg [Xenopus laevis]
MQNKSVLCVLHCVWHWSPVHNACPCITITSLSIICHQRHCISLGRTVSEKRAVMIIHYFWKFLINAYTFPILNCIQPMT